MRGDREREGARRGVRGDREREGAWRVKQVRVK